MKLMFKFEEQVLQPVFSFTKEVDDNLSNEEVDTLVQQWIEDVMTNHTFQNKDKINIQVFKESKLV